MAMIPFCAAFLAASAMAFASSNVEAIGFSQSTCFPAFSAAMAISAWALFGVQMLTTSISGSLTMSRQSVQHFSKPKRSFASAAISGTMSQIVFKTGTAGAGQKYLGMSEYPIECAFPMNPAPTRPTFSFFIVKSSHSKMPSCAARR